MRGALRLRSHQLDPGGKGVNVAHALSTHEHKTTAVLPPAGSTATS